MISQQGGKHMHSLERPERENLRIRIELLKKGSSRKHFIGFASCVHEMHVETIGKHIDMHACFYLTDPRLVITSYLHDHRKSKLKKCSSPDARNFSETGEATIRS